jgi:hypothetical protein
LRQRSDELAQVKKKLERMENERVELQSDIQDLLEKYIKWRATAHDLERFKRVSIA